MEKIQQQQQGQQKGLLNQQQQQPGARGDAQEQISPELQGQFDIFMANGISIIHDEKVSEGLIKRILASDDSIEAIASATLDIIERLESSSKSSGVDLSDAVLVQGANQLMGEIISLAEMAGMSPLNEDQRYQAFSLATGKYLDNAVKTGKMTPDELQKMSDGVSQTSDGQRILERLQASEGGQRPELQQNQGMSPSQQQMPQQQSVGRM